MSKSSMELLAAAVTKPAGEKAADAPAKPAKKEKVAAAADAPKAEKKPKDEGPKVIKSNEDLMKAIWSSRGNVYAPVTGMGLSLAIVKSDLTNILKAGDLKADALFNLVTRKGPDGVLINNEHDLVPMVPAKA